MATYFVMGADQKEYGPVPADELRQWVAEGRLDAQSKIRLEGATDWRPLGQLPELAGPLSGKLSVPPPIQAPPPVGRTSAMAVSALILGVLGVFTCGGTALLGLILGIVAMVRVTNSRGALTGKGLALAGVIISGVLLILLPVVFIPALAAATQRAQQIACMNNERQLAQAVLAYSGQHGHHFPPAATWCHAIRPNAGSEAVFRCPAAPLNRSGYAFNGRLDGADATKVNAGTVMLLDSEGGWNAHGGFELAAARHRVHHGRFVNVAFADGHVERVSEDQLSALRWEP
jgi:prepilin-type processing-associated H-X9-DG protein